MTLAIIFAVFTLLTLIIGIIVMARGGKGSSKNSNKLMIMRVSFQALAVICLVIVAVFFGR